MGDTNPILMFLQSFVAQTVDYLAVVGLLFAVFWVWGNAERAFCLRHCIFTARSEVF